MPSPTWTKAPNGHQLGDPAVDELAHPMVAGELLPRVLLGGLEREADALAVEVDLEDLHLDLVADLHDRAGVVDVLPRQLGHVDEPVHAAEVDERTEVDHRRDGALADLARLEVGEEVLALLLLGLLQPGPAGQHHVVAVLVELDDLGLEAAADVGLQVADPAQLDQRRRQEAPQADVEDQAALDDLDDRAADDALFFLDLLDRAPGPLVLGPLLGQDEPALLVLLLEDEGLDGVAERHDLAGIDVVADRELTSGDDALGLVPDVEQDLVTVDLDDGALDDLAVLDLDHGGRVGLVHGHAAQVVLGDRPGDVAAVLGEGAHARRRGGLDGLRVRLVGRRGGCFGRVGALQVGHVRFSSLGFSGQPRGRGARRAGRSTLAGAGSVPPPPKPAPPALVPRPAGPRPVGSLPQAPSGLSWCVSGHLSHIDLLI